MMQREVNNVKRKIEMGGLVGDLRNQKQGLYKTLKAFYENVDNETAESVNAVRGCLTYIETLQSIMNAINENMKM